MLSIHVTAVVRISFLLQLKHIPLHIFTTSSLSTLISWILRLLPCPGCCIVLLRAWRCMYPFELVFSLPLDKCPELEFLGHMIVLYLIFWETSILFSIVHHFVFPSMVSELGFPFLYVLANTCSLIFLIIVIVILNDFMTSLNEVISYSQLFLRSPQTTISPFCISFSWWWS